MTQDKQVTADKNPAKLQQGRFTIFDALPIILALAIAIFSAMYVDTKFGILASIGAFIVVAILAYLIIGYAAHVFFTLIFRKR